MESEVAPEVLRVLNDRYLEQGAPGITDVVKRLGVSVTPKGFEHIEYAWKLPGSGFLVTIWAEDVRVHPSGKWFYVDTLDTVHRRGGGVRDANQQKRAVNRVAILREMHRKRQDCIGLLQTNLRSIEELEQNANATVSRRVKDGEHWHVASWDEERQRLVLVRGEDNWAPSPEDIDAPPASEALPPKEPVPPDPTDQPRLVFPDQQHRDQVEAASMAYVTKHYEDRRFNVDDVSADNLGYDLEIRDKASGSVEHVEVKGTSMDTPAFFLTRNESNRAKSLPSWRLAIVTSALTQPKLEVLASQEMVDRFDFDALVWRCTAKPAGELSEQDRAPE